MGCIRQYYYNGSCGRGEAVSLHFGGAKGRDRMGADAQRALQTFMHFRRTLHVCAPPCACSFEHPALHPRAGNLVKQQITLHALLWGPKDKEHKVALNTLPPLLRPPSPCQYTRPHRPHMDPLLRGFHAIILLLFCPLTQRRMLRTLVLISQHPLKPP